MVLFGRQVYFHRDFGKNDEVSPPDYKKHLTRGLMGVPDRVNGALRVKPRSV